MTSGEKLTWIRKVFFVSQWKQPCLTFPMELKPKLENKKVEIELLSLDPLEFKVRVLPDDVSKEVVAVEKD